MKNLLKRIWKEEQGTLTFEWILVITLIVVGIVGGLSAVRDAVVDELGDVAEATMHIDQSWTVETSPCDPLGMDFGSYTDPYAGTAAGTSINTRKRLDPFR